MKRMNYLLIITCLALFCFGSTGCGKDEVYIGNKGPEEEVKKCIRLSKKKKYESTVQCLEMFKARYPQSKEGVEAELMIGDVYFDKKDYLLAAESYAAFIKLHPLHPKVDYAYYRRGVALFKESPKAIDRDQQYLGEAIANLEIVIRRYPNSSYRPLALKYYREARLRVAKRNMYVGRFYYRTGEYKACIPRLMEVATQYKETGLAPKALYMAIIANIKLDDLASARDAFGMLSIEYPDNKYTKRAEKKLSRAVKKSQKKASKEK